MGIDSNKLHRNSVVGNITATVLLHHLRYHFRNNRFCTNCSNNSGIDSAVPNFYCKMRTIHFLRAALLSRITILFTPISYHPLIITLFLFEFVFRDRHCLLAEANWISISSISVGHRSDYNFIF